MRFTNQAKRVINHISEQVNISPDDVGNIFGFTVEVIENRIQLMHTMTGQNGYKCADALIDLWEQSRPGYSIEKDRYSNTHTYQDIEYRYRIIPGQEIIFLLTDDLISLPYKDEALTDEYLDTLCSTVLQIHNDKLTRIHAD